MAFKFNAITGQLDLVSVPLKNGTVSPLETVTNGDIELADISTDGRIYFKVNDVLYYVSGTRAQFPIRIAQGQPVGLMGVTYAEDVS